MNTTADMASRDVAVGAKKDDRARSGDVPRLLAPSREPRFARFADSGVTVVWLWLWLVVIAAHAGEPLRVSVYATAGDTVRHLVPVESRPEALIALRSLGVQRVFLEGRRGDEYVPPDALREVRDWLKGQGIATSGGIATVPGSTFGRRQNEGLGWLNWEDAKTRADVAAFFTENAPLFSELIVDDFYCTGDTSPASEAARGGRDWSRYRRDLLVASLDPLVLEPARAANPDIRLILKFPQWYDRFHLFGYDPPRMSVPFDAIWVGTEVRNPATRRMGYVPPTEGYVNFRWLSSVAGSKVIGAWFDHIECTPQNFVDQAFQSVLAGARELTLFHFGDLMSHHPGDVALARRLPELRELAGRIDGQDRLGIACYKPPGSDSDENVYVMEYLAYAGLPILPCSTYPLDAAAVVLPVQAAANPAVLGLARAHLMRGGTVAMTPAFVRRAGGAAAELAGVTVTETAQPAIATRISWADRPVPLEAGLEIDRGLAVTETGAVRAAASVDGKICPWLIVRQIGPGRVVVLNVRTFSEQDFRDADEWLLAPKPRGLSVLAQPIADGMRGQVLDAVGVSFEAPTGVSLSLFDHGACVYSFLDAPVSGSLNGRRFELPAHGWQWMDGLDATSLR